MDLRLLHYKPYPTNIFKLQHKTMLMTFQSRTNQQRVGPIWSTSLRVDYCYLKFSNHNGSITKPAYLHLDRRVHQISSVTLAKPALVYTSIHLTVTARYSCGDSLRLDFTCGRSGSFKVRRERARRPWDRFPQ
jgi:hypothetical protein